MKPTETLASFFVFSQTCVLLSALYKDLINGANKQANTKSSSSFTSMSLKLFCYNKYCFLRVFFYTRNTIVPETSQISTFNPHGTLTESDKRMTNVYNVSDLHDKRKQRAGA
ncbi:hypothetical protein DPMN_175602 [Dreissena polymorpha]|uniref:Secreted protein n=1 Tax=Dreissena polymorpha TaxID=45954 RepID=A0A9D4E9P8_DREPO|nr:hypothetical protein DPMN_175602 [Dreissena polymorpha]